MFMVPRVRGVCFPSVDASPRMRAGRSCASARSACAPEMARVHELKHGSNDVSGRRTRVSDSEQRRRGEGRGCGTHR